MAGPRDTLGSPWPPHEIRPDFAIRLIMDDDQVQAKAYALFLVGGYPYSAEQLSRGYPL
jgi:hypothetical protein